MWGGGRGRLGDGIGRGRDGGRGWAGGGWGSFRGDRRGVGGVEKWAGRASGRLCRYGCVDQMRGGGMESRGGLA